ncbi:2-amino-4-hydroxy-6-hydroxymethyldihydropteridine diphosphokinase [Halalkalibacterium ligniniphilum]|uniref:2-amino-4-hydroxy-6- hydroxymethyldihydropteridine diphosphokinase n=1 Tax=Halalkalibacterium ligniniphilum TaxID=1134413 RepID=UPI00034D0E39|nr:2-amino-4-hydroxy-6-hydroxymethyldihydropteridine diphosphokinase [Halalkalibacterium ligniniphilum]
MNHIVYLALGSNLGDREQFLKNAILYLSEHPHIIIKKLSSIYETEPVGYVDQDPFLNMVVEIQTSLDALSLLSVTQEIEEKCDRVRAIRWGPRTIDLDILLYDQENMKMENLCIPHPRMWERAFVIVPLMELNSTLVSPHADKPITEVYGELADKEGVKLWKKIAWVEEYGLSGN